MSGPPAANAYRSYCISTTRRLRRGDLVLVELDTYADGYWSDLTRMFVIGEPTSEQQRIFDSVLEAQQEAIKSIKSGVKASDIDGIARNIAGKHGYRKYFPHRLGHGIGLQLHELPVLHPASGDILSPGMVHSVEPGIYIPGFGGIRVEDDILDLERGYEYLSEFDRTLIRA